MVSDYFESCVYFLLKQALFLLNQQTPLARDAEISAVHEEFLISLCLCGFPGTQRQTLYVFRRLPVIH